jgi:hypothetical protein
MKGLKLWLLVSSAMAMAAAIGLAGCINDPAPGLFQSKANARALECVQVDQAEAHALHPNQVSEPSPRASNLQNNDALLCSPRMMRQDERPARDELILSSLRSEVGEIDAIAASLSSPDLTWHVDAYYPQPEVASKIAIAAKTDLAERGQRVSDRPPLLAAGDVSVLHDLSPRKAYPLACARYFAEGGLTDKDGLLALMIVDPREGQLHAGVCLRGTWRWLQ